MTRATVSRSENEIIFRLGITSYTGQFLAEQFEVLPGTWSVEIWFGSTKPIEQSFTLDKPLE